MDPTRVRAHEWEAAGYPVGVPTRVPAPPTHGFTVARAHEGGRSSSALHTQRENFGSAEPAVWALPWDRYQEASAHHGLHLLDWNIEEVGCTGDAEHLRVIIHLARCIIGRPRTRLDAGVPGLPGV